MKVTRTITYTAEINNTTVPLTFQPVDHPKPLGTKSGDKLIIVYAVQDEHFSLEDLLGDGMGKLLSLHRHDKTRGQALAALGLDQYDGRDEDPTIVRYATYARCPTCGKPARKTSIR